MTCQHAPMYLDFPCCHASFRDWRILGESEYVRTRNAPAEAIATLRVFEDDIVGAVLDRASKVGYRKLGVL